MAKFNPEGAQMKALVKHGSAVGVESLVVPAPARAGDVLIRIALAGLCRTDIYVAESRIPSKNPLILGHEFSGFVEWAPGDGGALKQGDRVAVMPWFAASDGRLSDGRPSYAGATMMGVDHDGAFSEFVVAPAKAVYRLPGGVSFMQGAYMEPVAASLAVLNAAIRPEQKGLIFGDNRISRLTERILRAKGFADIAVCGAGEGLPENAYDFIIETWATSETMGKIVRAVKPGGRIVLKSRQHAPVAFDINLLVMKDITLEAVSYGDFQEGIDLVANGELKVDDLFGDVFRLDQFETAFAESRRGESKKLFLSAADRDLWAC
jgi:L-iditol 2-dehydrogenase